MAPSAAPTSFPKERIKVLLLEGISPTAEALFAAEQFQVTTVRHALAPEALQARLHDVHLLGIRSKTHLGMAELAAARRLLAVGCFCIGTNQVDLGCAREAGVPVFNAPFSNTRSVAELVICEVVALARKLGDRSREMHAGQWHKQAQACFEVRGKTLGIVGYGHIGSQVGTLAEMLGMQVLYHDIAQKLPLGNARPAASLEALLRGSDFVTLHVPATPQTHHLLDAVRLAQMRGGAYLINNSRGHVVQLPHLAAALQSGALGGAAIDVYPEEPEANGSGFVTPLQHCPNTLLTPHIGGSTEEAQAAIGQEVAKSLIDFVNAGTTSGSVNFPRLAGVDNKGQHRILNIHRNVPGVLRDVNRIVSDLHANIHGQMLGTEGSVGYLIMDLDTDVSRQVHHALAALDTTIRTRILY